METEYFTVTDLKQYMMCPRILYYHACLPDVRPVTDKMQVSIRRHQKQPPQAKRRTLNLTDIQDRWWNVSFISETLKLSGQVDELILTGSGYVPVDYKLSRKAGEHFRLQLTAYAMLIESTYNCQIDYGVLYLLQSRKSEQVDITPSRRRKVLQALDTMQAIANLQQIPEATPNRYLCRECEFRRFCNDV